MERSAEHNWTPDEVRRIVNNPIYAGIGPYPALITDEQWIQAAMALIASEGPRPFLVHLLHLLRQAFPAEG